MDLISAGNSKHVEGFTISRHELIILFFPPYYSISLFQPNPPIILQAISDYSHFILMVG